VTVGTNVGVASQGALGAIIAQFMTTYQCPKCGKIKFSDFPPETRSKLRSNLWVGVLVGLVILAALIGLLVWGARSGWF
jgi:hypothetical protein